MGKIPTTPTIHPDLWVYNVDYVDTSEFRNKGWKARHAQSKLTMPEISYLCRAPHAITIISMSIEPESLYTISHNG